MDGPAVEQLNKGEHELVALSEEYGGWSAGPV